MKSNEKFVNKPLIFWGNVKFLSESLGYSVNANTKLGIEGKAKSYTYDECIKAYRNAGLNFEPNLVLEIIEYLNYRANLINNHIKNQLMRSEDAKQLYKQVYETLYDPASFKCDLPVNKQKGNKSGPNYFTCMINILTESTIRNYYKENHISIPEQHLFNSNPQNLTYFTDNNNNILHVLSRRFDGAYPSTTNPLAIWEIKEYYYTTTFGSRIADGVYETQLDGFEINQIENTFEEIIPTIKHYYLIDAYDTWFTKGKSYLCRIIDMLHMNLVDDVLFGKEIIDEWPKLITNLLEQQHSTI